MATKRSDAAKEKPQDLDRWWIRSGPNGEVKEVEKRPTDAEMERAEKKYAPKRKTGV